MDFLSPLSNNITISTSTIACTFVVLFFLCNTLLSKPKHNQKMAPEPAGAWPIIGHLHLLAGGRKPPHLILASLADKYGPIFRLRLGAHPVVVVSDAKTAQECFTVKDKKLATRPRALASEIMGYNYGMLGITPYGAYWREMRKIVVLELLSNRRTELLRPLRKSHIGRSIKRAFDHWSENKDAVSGAAAMEMRQWFGSLVMNMSVSMLFGEDEVVEESKFQRASRRLFELFGAAVVADFIPWLRWLDIGGHEKAMRETAMEMESFAERWMEEHKRKRKSKSSKEEEADFMDTMLSLFETTASSSHQSRLPGGYDTDQIIKSTCLAMLLAATDTTSVTLIWALSLVLNNYEVLERIQDELDTHVGKERRVEESDLKELIYLQAVIKETMRLYPAVPLSVPHEAMEDCIINNYHIQKGTRLITNFVKIHRDPKVWAKPDEFRPERFLTHHKDVDVRGNNFELIPFGSGRRMCPGISLALEIVQLALASLVHGFDMRRISNEPIDLTESCGLTNFKATPLQALLIPRLESNLYG
ncbi:PREDICTED: cytochrome P450 CYP82D47-like [Ipomoea nil]|uniref:cytochrome P450 CYP82D47-like n=1 Tax=Ipomoea nil TaxID=35883 RepID=UPI000901F987|nr:PREDICTED: cytochrome P450 CYP82D47-like [Ipomoea nil]